MEQYAVFCFLNCCLIYLHRLGFHGDSSPVYIQFHIRVPRIERSAELAHARGCAAHVRDCVEHAHGYGAHVRGCVEHERKSNYRNETAGVARKWVPRKRDKFLPLHYEHDPIWKGSFVWPASQFVMFQMGLGIEKPVA